MVTAPPAAAAAAALGLHCYGLAVQGVTVNGLAANFEVVQPVRWVWQMWLPERPDQPVPRCWA